LKLLLTIYKRHYTSKPTFNFKMNTAPLIKDYHTPSILVSIKEAKEFIEDLLKENNNNKVYYTRHKATFTQEEEKEIILEIENIQDEIDYYETCISHIQQTYEDNPESRYGYSLISTNPSGDNKEEEEKEVVHPVSEKNDELEGKINRIEEVVYQLVGGLFNHETQFGIIDSHNACLFGRESSSSIGNQSVYPTTRQGDANEEEIRLLKLQVSKLEGTVNILMQLLSEKINK
jgi:hypothetical protein